MSDFRTRTLDPRHATLFYMPTFAIYTRTGNSGIPGGHFTRLKAQATEWGKRVPNGREHVFFLDC